MKRSTLLIKSLIAIVATSLCLPLCGCGGGGSSSSYHSPTTNEEALFAPYLGTYNGVNAYDPTDAAGDFTLILSIGTGSHYGATVPVVVATASNVKSSILNDDVDNKPGRAYLKDATLSADGTQITSLKFIYPNPVGPSIKQFILTVSPSSTSGVLNGVVSDSSSILPIQGSQTETLTRVSQ